MAGQVSLAIRLVLMLVATILNLRLAIAKLELSVLEQAWVVVYLQLQSIVLPMS